MTEPEAYAGLTEIFRETFGDPSLPLTPEMTAQDVPGWDSLRMVIIIIAVEERFGIRLRTSEMDRLHCVGDFVALLLERQPA